MKNLNVSKEKPMFNYDNIVDQLRANVLQVTFSKVNGEERIMPCTLHTDYMPALSESKVQQVDEFSVNKSVIRAFAIDKQSWRSFRVDNVKAIEIVNG
tara:strand:- start:305 stop:598 length:294 start_codon:yes stop_codon:yes gene_type:complete